MTNHFDPPVSHRLVSHDFVVLLIRKERDQLVSTILPLDRVRSTPLGLELSRLYAVGSHTLKDLLKHQIMGINVWTRRARVPPAMLPLFFREFRYSFLGIEAHPQWLPLDLCRTRDRTPMIERVLIKTHDPGVNDHVLPDSVPDIVLTAFGLPANKES